MTESERRWSLTAAISSIAAFGIGVGLGAPLLSLLLEERGTNAAVNGLNAGATFIGVFFGPLLVPWLIGRFGFRRVLLACLALNLVGFWCLKIFDQIGIWFILRFATGIAGSIIFTATEAWISMIAGDKSRGRIIGLYASALSAGFGLGPLILSAIGTAGYGPFIANSVILVLAAMPLFMVPEASHGMERNAGFSPFSIFLKAPTIVLAVGLFGLYEGATIALLPIWGVRIGLSSSLSAATLSAIYFGSIALQIPIGYLSDKVTRSFIFRLCSLAGLIGALLLPFVATSMPPLFVLLFIWGGLVTGLYPIALSLAGDRFRGAELVTANAALVMSYGVGALIGPTLGGAAMDLWNPQGLPAMLALLFAIFLATTFIRPRMA